MDFFVPFFLKKRHHGGVAGICLRVSEVTKRPQVRVFFLKGTVLFFFSSLFQADGRPSRCLWSAGDAARGYARH
jgi:hypothetical protein